MFLGVIEKNRLEAYYGMRGLAEHIMKFDPSDLQQVQKEKPYVRVNKHGGDTFFVEKRWKKRKHLMTKNGNRRYGQLKARDGTMQRRLASLEY